MPPAEVFLSHSSQDRDMAARLAAVLSGHGIPVFYSPHAIIGAQQWQDEILNALRRCDWFMVLLSPDAVESMWVKREIAFALSERRYENRIIPLKYRACELGPVEWLKLCQMVDFSPSVEFPIACRNLLRIWGVGLRVGLMK